MNKKDTLKLVRDNDIELSVEQIDKLNRLHKFIEDSEKYIQDHGETIEAMGGLQAIEGNVAHCHNEVVDTIFSDFTTWYKHHNSDIANVAMYKLADWLEKADFHVWNSTYGNDQFASITVDFDCFQKKVQIFIPNSTKFDGDNEEDNQYWVQPKNADDECIMEGQYFDIDDLSGIEKYCTALYKFFDAQQDLEILQA